MSSCSEQTKIEGDNLGDRYLDAVTFGIDFMNYEPWIEFATDWVLNNPIIHPPFMHELNKRDDMICRQNFVELQNLYATAYESMKGNVLEFNNLHRRILTIVEKR